MPPESSNGAGQDASTYLEGHRARIRTRAYANKTKEETQQYEGTMSLVAAAEEDLKAGEHMALADKRFLLQRPDSLVSQDEKAKLKEEVMAGIKENNMSVFYEETCAKLGWEVDQTFLTTMKKANEEKLKELAEQLEKAKSPKEKLKF